MLTQTPKQTGTALPDDVYPRQPKFTMQGTRKKTSTKAWPADTKMIGSTMALTTPRQCSITWFSPSHGYGGSWKPNPNTSEKASYILSDNGGNGKRGRYNGEVAGGSETNVGLRCRKDGFQVHFKFIDTKLWGCRSKLLNHKFRLFLFKKASVSFFETNRNLNSPSTAFVCGWSHWEATKN